MKDKLEKDELLRLLDKIMRPKIYGLSEKESDEVMLTFCAGCPDPVKARWLVVECLEPMSDEDLIDRALAMPLRRMADVPFSEFPEGHPLRTAAL
jgi:hypothetical protein